MMVLWRSSTGLIQYVRSADSGATWTQYDFPGGAPLAEKYTQLHIRWVPSTEGNTMYYQAVDGSFIRAIFNGTSKVWTTEPSGLPTSGIGGFGVYRTPLDAELITFSNTSGTGAYYAYRAEPTHEFTTYEILLDGAPVTNLAGESACCMFDEENWGALFYLRKSGTNRELWYTHGSPFANTWTPLFKRFAAARIGYPVAHGMVLDGDMWAIHAVADEGHITKLNVSSYRKSIT
jgi:hypothetical protein